MAKNTFVAEGSFIQGNKEVGWASSVSHLKYRMHSGSGV